MNDVLLPVEVQKFIYLQKIAEEVSLLQMSWNAEIISKHFDAGDPVWAAAKAISEIPFKE